MAARFLKLNLSVWTHWINNNAFVVTNSEIVETLIHWVAEKLSSSKQ